MKKLLILLFLLSSSVCAFAGNWWVINTDNEVIGMCRYQPDADDLATRNETAVFSKKDLSFYEAEYRGGKIVKHVKTKKEKEQEEADRKWHREMKRIEKHMKRKAMKELEAEGDEFVEVKKDLEGGE